MTTSDPCLHCQRRPGIRCRGLCKLCYRLLTQAQRKCYPLGFRGEQGIVSGHGRLPAEPTDAVPGTEKKIRVLMARAERGEALFHPRDATMLDRYPTAAAEILARLLPPEDEEGEHEE
jgi:hypothetical protein